MGIGLNSREPDSLLFFHGLLENKNMVLGGEVRYYIFKGQAKTRLDSLPKRDDVDNTDA